VCVCVCKREGGDTVDEPIHKFTFTSNTLQVNDDLQSCKIKYV